MDYYYQQHHTSRTPEKGAHSPTWPNGLIINIMKHLAPLPEKNAYSPSWLNGPIINIIRERSANIQGTFS
jgi:hypothetical protein